MKLHLPASFLIGPCLLFSTFLAGQDQAFSFGNEKTSWHEGFDRYDFLMDSATLAIEPIKAPEGEKYGVGEPAKGQRRCILVVPQKAAPGNPWSWRGCYWDHQPQTEIELLRRGFCIAYISASATIKPGREWDAWYAFLTERHGLSPRPAFVGMSRGGEYAYIWGTTHPDKVSCIYADNPGMNRETLMKLGELARNDVPLLHVCGSIDPILGDNALFIEELYRQLGGRISTMIKDGYAHHPHSLPDPKPIADWIEKNSTPTHKDPPAFAGPSFTKTSYYSTHNQYRYVPEEKAWITSRGAGFEPCYDRDAEMDLALLARGFHIVTGPVSFNSDSLLLKDWNATYQLLVANGFSARPVMEGAGGAAGEVMGWTIENPDKVSGIYLDNPLLHTTFSAKPLLGNLTPLIAAGIPLSLTRDELNPAWKENGRLLEQRYRQAGGKVAVKIKNQEKYE